MALTPDSSLRAAAALYERYGRALPGVAAAVFAVLLGRVLADLVWAVVPVPESARWHPAPPPPAARVEQGVDVNAIANSGLFGRYQAPPTGNAALLSAPETPLNLVLIGLLADDRQAYSRALISQNGQEASYAIGDDVARGVTLQAIFPDRVILNRNGRMETLPLDREHIAPGSSLPAAAAPAAPADDGSAVQLSTIRDEVLKWPSKASEYVRLQPANVAGQLKGYRVYPGRERAAFSAAGLRPGDLVTAVNGVQLDDPAKALQLLGELGQAGQINLVVERGGQSQNISINLSQ